MSSRVHLFFPPRGHEPPPTLRDRLNQRHRFPVPRYAKRPDVALHAIGLLFLFPTPSSPHCTLKVSKHHSLRQPPTTHSDKRPRPQKSSRWQRRLNALKPGYLKGTVLYEVIRWYGPLHCAPMIRSKTRWCTVRSLA